MTNTYDTSGLPLGTTSPKALYNNASNMDEGMNSPGAAFIDRLGFRRQTWAGMESAFATLLANSGFETAHLVYVDGNPLIVNRPTQLIDRGSSVYRVKTPATFPVNLSGTWSADELLLVDVGDVALRAELASSTGGDLVGANSFSTVGEKLRQTGSIVDFGADMTGLIDATPAFVAAVAAYDDVIVPPGVALLSANWTLPNGKRLLFQGGAVSVSFGVTLTLRGMIDAPHRQIFQGLGSVVGLRRVKPQWFGAVGDGVVNDLPALQKAHDCAEQSAGSDGGEVVIELGAGAFGIASVWELRPTKDFSLRVRGAGVTGLYGSRIVQLGSGSFTGSAAVRINGQVNSIAAIVDWELTDFAIIGTGLGTVIGLQIGTVNANLGGVRMSRVEGVYVEGFALGIRIAQTRLVQFSRCAVWNNNVLNSKCLQIAVDPNTVPGFTGDLVFDNCQFVSANTVGQWCVELLAAESGQSGIAGVKFTKCIMYHGYRLFSIAVANGCAVSDIWISDGCQFDGLTTQGLRAESTASGPVSTLSDLRITDCYFQGIAEPLTLLADNTGVITNVNIAGNWTNGMANGITLQGIKGLTYKGNIHSDYNIGSQAVVEMITVNNAVINGNLLRRTAAQVCGYFISIQGASNDFIISDNSAGAIPTSGIVRDLTSATRRVVTDNI